MLKPKAAIFSDLHLGIYNNSELWHQVALDWVDWIVKDLTKKKIKDIFFLGDFFHNRSEISVQTLHVGSLILQKLKDFNVVFIVGNHDAFYKHRSDVHSMGIINGYENFTLVDKTTQIDAFGKKMLFVPWNAEIPDEKYDYMFGHFEIQTFKMNNYKVCDHGLFVVDLLSKSPMVFSGHFHHRNSKSYNEGTVVYVGNTFPMDFSDVDNVKGYHVLDVETGALEFTGNYVSPVFKRVPVSKIKEFKEKDIKNNVIRLLIDLEMTEKNVEKFQSYIQKFKPFQLTTEYVITSKSVSDVEEIESLDMVEVFDEYIEQLKLEDDKKKRVEAIIKELYDKHK